MNAKTVKTRWELRTYDVWGNAKDGYDVNDTCVVARDYPLTLTVKHNNVGTPHAFDSAYPTDSQIRRAFGLRRFRLETTGGDDLTIYVNRARDGYPIGEMHCVSHASLSSPIREA